MPIFAIEAWQRILIYSRFTLSSLLLLGQSAVCGQPPSPPALAERVSIAATVQPSLRAETKSEAKLDSDGIRRATSSERVPLKSQSLKTISEFKQSAPQGAAALLPIDAPSNPARPDQPTPDQPASDQPASDQPALPPTTSYPAFSDPLPSPVASTPPADPELGVLRVQERPLSNSPTDPTLPNQPTNPSSTPDIQPTCDPELGCPRFEEVPIAPPAPRTPFLYLVGRLSYFRSSNVNAAALRPIDDAIFRPGLTLYTVPQLGPDTYFIASIDGNLARYGHKTEFSYNEIFLRAGILQRLSPVMFGEIGWSNQQLFLNETSPKRQEGNLVFPSVKAGTRFFNDHAIRLELRRRDVLAQRLSLDTFYQLRWSFTNPSNRSRIGNLLQASLNYDLQPNLQLGVDYLFSLTNFTRQFRVDQYHSITARLSYTLFRNTQVSIFGGYSFGRSTDSMVDFNGSILGVSMSVTWGLF